MPEDEFRNAPMVLTKFTEGFAEIDYTVPLNGPFEVTVPLQAIELEARAKSCAVVIQVSLITLDEFWGDLVEETEGETDERPE